MDLHFTQQVSLYPLKRFWPIVCITRYKFMGGRNPAMHYLSTHHQIFLSITIHHSVEMAEWKWVGRVNSDWWAVKKTTNSDKCEYTSSSWKIHKLFWEKSSDAPNKALILLVCKCRLLGLTNAKWPNQQIQISAVSKYICMILTNPRGPTILMSSLRHGTCISWNVLSSRSSLTLKNIIRPCQWFNSTGKDWKAFAKYFISGSKIFLSSNW